MWINLLGTGGVSVGQLQQRLLSGDRQPHMAVYGNKDSRIHSAFITRHTFLVCIKCLKAPFIFLDTIRGMYANVDFSPNQNHRWVEFLRITIGVEVHQYIIWFLNTALGKWTCFCTAVPAHLVLL